MRGSQLYATDARRTTREIPPLVRSRSLALSLSLTPSLAKKKLFFCSEELPPPQGAPSRALPGDLNPPCYLYVSFFSRIFIAVTPITPHYTSIKTLSILLLLCLLSFLGCNRV